jgi:hypothetical protein
MCCGVIIHHDIEDMLHGIFVKNTHALPSGFTKLISGKLGDVCAIVVMVIYPQKLT